MNRSSGIASQVVYSSGERLSPMGPITNAKGNLDLSVSYFPEAVTLHITMPDLPTVQEAAKKPGPAGNFEATGPARLERSLVYNPRAQAHQQIGIDIGSSTIDTRM